MRAGAVLLLAFTGFCLARTARADIPVDPILVLDADFRQIPRDTEGYGGFALPHVQLGAAVSMTDSVQAMATLGYAGEGIGLSDTGVRWAARTDVGVAVGYFKTPLFLSGHDQFEERLPVPERSMVVQALWPGRDLGVEGHWFPKAWPVEAWLRVSNGFDSATSNDNADVAVSGRIDLALGRAHAGADPRETWGLRLGCGALFDPKIDDRASVTGKTAAGFEFWRAPIVSAARTVVEGHLLVQAGPVQATVEGGAATEGRSLDTDGNPDTPRVPQPSITAWGVAGELAWMVTGEHRAGDAWPATSTASAFGALEVAARLERLKLGTGAVDVASGGAWSMSAAIRWWLRPRLALSVAGYGYSFDTAPLQTPGNTTTWLALSRLTFSLR